jgi:predicted Ser/Thr protein kinase
LVTSRSTSNGRRSEGATEPERVLAGRYQLGPILGRGGMATVYRGTDLLLGRDVAVKVLSASAEADPDFVARFRREARAAASLNHPNVVSVFDTGSDGDTHFIVMEYVEGATLAEVLREGGALAPRRAAEIAEAICTALEAAHERGLVHRDIKPGNVMVTPSGDVKVMDFGIARSAASESFTRPGTVLGTAWYLSPEQARGQPADARSDLYSVGCVLYEMLTGRPPFVGESPVAIAYQHVSERAPRLIRIDPEIPAALDAVARKALAKDPARRYQSARDMRAALDAALASVPDGAAVTEPLAGEPRPTDALATLPIARPAPTQALPAEPATEVARRKRRVPRWAIVVLGVAVLAAVVLGIGMALSGGPLPLPTQPPKTTRAQSPAATTVADAYSALTQAIVAGEQSGEESQHAGDDLMRRANDILRSYQDGEGEDTSKKIDDMQKRIDDLAGRGEITSASETAALHRAVSALGAAMQSGET